MIENKRLEEFDVLKGVCLLCVIAGHRLSVDNFSSLLIFIYTFHLPVFLFISGYFFKQYSGFLFLQKTIKRLLIPFSIFLFFRFLLEKPDDFYIKELFFSNPPFCAIWYLPSLFFALNIYNAIYSNKYLLFFLCIILPLIGALLFRVTYAPLFLFQSLCMLPFLLLGNISKKYNILEKLNPVLFIFALLLWTVYVFTVKNQLLIALCSFNWFFYGDLVVSFSAFLSLFMIISYVKNRLFRIFFSRLGYYSLSILCFHSITRFLFDGFPWFGSFYKYTSWIGPCAYEIFFLIFELVFLIVMTFGIQIIVTYKNNLFSVR